MKKYFCTAMCAVLLCLMLFGCGKAEKTYLQEINGYSFWENDLSTAVPEYRTYDHVHAFLDEGTLQNGDMVSKDGKVRKVLFLGFDGMRADALTNVLVDENTFDTNGYNAQPPHSGIREPHHIKSRKTAGKEALGGDLIAGNPCQAQRADGNNHS